MRLRNVKGSREAMVESEYVFTEPGELLGKWREIFENDAPIYIEIGMGKGQFITTLAMQNPNINFVGIEKYSSVLVRAVEKQNELKLPNLKFIRMDAEEITDVFMDGEISRIFLNFSDPWPKDRHAKRRLTSKEFLARYDHILVPEGEIHFKTDNNDLFDFSLKEIEESQKWETVSFTRDLHNDEKMNIGNVMTEYEQRFSLLGNPINKLIAKRRAYN